MEKRRLGRTNHDSSLVIFGAAALSEVDSETAERALDMALAAGVNHIDVAPQYGHAEERVGPWLEPRRDQFFVGCKTLERQRDAAWAELHRSLEKLRTPQLDLYQLHAVVTHDELDQAFAAGGAIEALAQAKEQGLTRFLGITGHGLEAPRIQLEALRRFDFDTVMFPLNPVLYANADYRRDAERLLETCAARDVGVMIIKAIAKGPWGDQPRKYASWYEPFDQPEMVALGVRFALSQPGVTAVASAGDVRLLRLVLPAGAQFTPLSADAQAAAIAQAAALEPLFT
jgi:aryl-alcohol dehydrogenase-like predicted oxidoreductase